MVLCKNRKLLLAYLKKSSVNSVYKTYFKLFPSITNTWFYAKCLYWFNFVYISAFDEISFI